ncbi:MAG TPA: spore germination protein GerW family protein, partial [bacterium]|nr:spore germination protein GerW family protein [bacterium]
MFLDDLQKRFAEMQSKAGVEAVFGEPIQLDGRTVIPVASIRYGFGMGGGTGPRKDRDGDTVGGGGGGGAARIEPVALIEAVDGRIRVQPIINVTRLAAIAAGVLVWAIFWITRT